MLALMMNTGLDPSDALRLRNDQVDDGTIWGVRGKTGEEIAIPVSSTLQAALDRMPNHDAETVLSNSRGEAWTYNGFSTVWHRFKTALENEGLIEKGLTLKGLRHTVATTLREAGLDERRIADLLGRKHRPWRGTIRGQRTLPTRTARPWPHWKKRTEGGPKVSNLRRKASNPTETRISHEQKI